MAALGMSGIRPVALEAALPDSPSWQLFLDRSNDADQALHIRLSRRRGPRVAIV
jgi:hypothetical protein